MSTVRPTVLAVVLLIIAGVSITFATRSAAQGGPEDSPRTTLAEFKKLVEAGNVVVIDVRGDQTYRAGHIPGAVSVPLETVAARAREWASETRPVVTYCSWPAENTSARAALTLLRAGVKQASALKGGYGEWVAAGNPVIQGPSPR